MVVRCVFVLFGCSPHMQAALCFESRGRLFRRGGGGSKEILLEIGVAGDDSRSSTVTI